MKDITYTKEADNIIRYSKEEAARTQSDSVRPEHLLLGIIRDGNNKAYRLLESLYIDMKKVRKQLEEILYTISSAKTELRDLRFNDSSTKILRLGILEAKIDNRDEFGAEHILLGIMRDNYNNANNVLNENEVTYNKLRERMRRIFSDDSENVPQLDSENVRPTSGMSFDEDEDEDEGIGRKGSGMNKYNPGNELGRNQATHTSNSSKDKQQGDRESKTPALDNYGIDLTRAAEEGKLDKVVGREKEIERVAQILSRRKKNNPVLIGEPGVGKSAIVEGLAIRIAEKKVSRLLFDKRVVMLDMTSVVAGTKYRGQFEERILGIINEAKNNPDVILFIDEIHTIVGAGSAAGSMDAANILKPALARGEIQCIGATTLNEYRQSVEKDGALERRFQKVMVEPTTADETLQILMNIKEQYEEHHNVNYTDEAIKACVRLTERYITDRAFPDKAIDAMDEAGSRVHINNVSVPKAIEEQEKLVEEAKENKHEAIRLQNFEMAASLRDKEKFLQNELEEMKREWTEKMKENRVTVDKEQIEDVVSMISGVPVQKMADSEGAKLKRMKDVLTSKVIGQDEAVDTLVRAIKRSRVGLKDPNKPIGTFLFTGPTGVGKTHLAKALAEEMFGSKDSLIRIDMSEYMEKFAVSRLVGAPPGYVGYEEGGQLTEKVRRKPYSIILLDELEKAHSDVFNLLLQVMDEGRLTDSNGRTVDFKNTVIIMTSNVGSRQLKDFSKGIGFNAVIKQDDPDHSKTVIRKALDKAFAPEFINRIDEIISFRQLDMDALVKITEIELSGLFKRVEALGYSISITDDAKKLIARKGEDVQYGARPLKRAIQSNIEDKLAEILMEDEAENCHDILIGTSEDGKEIAISIK